MLNRKLLSLFLLLMAAYSFGQFRCQEVRSVAAMQVSATSINNNAKSDTIDILHYDLHLDFTQITQRLLSGHCDIRLTPKMNNVGGISLDLLKLTVDSIVENGQRLSYTYNDTIIRASFAGSISPSDTILLKVYYHGSPQGDGSGWGGWHSQNGYYFNLGVGFAADPHTYGRAWFPCFDNFVEKSVYDFHFTTLSPLRPYSNGIRISETVLSGDTILTHWQMSDPIPTYLASVAISNYAEINDTVQAARGPLPIKLMAKHADSTNIINSFIHLKPTILAFEDAYGPYEWQKVGYAVTSLGAMEHATSIHYPANLITGNLGGEDIMAHELAHHWWGDLVTCKTDADMWINEGMAEYSSHLYKEKVYGRAEYLQTVMENAYNVLDVAHVRDNGFKAIQGLSHDYVYGFHVYQKGAMVAHNLRAYLGDSLFFSGLTTLLQNNKFGNLTSTQFRDQLSNITGVSLTNFFSDWVFNPGFPQFSVDSLYTASFSQNNSVALTIAQRLRKAPALYQNIPVFITFFSETGDTTTRSFVMNGAVQKLSFQNLPFKPAFALPAYNGKLLSGNTYDRFLINHTGAYPAKRSRMRLTVNSVTDSAEIIVMHNWAGPGGKVPAGKDYHLSPQHYWTVQGIDLQDVDLLARLTISAGAYNLDEELIKNGMDSLVVLYRKDATHPWELYPYQTKTQLGLIGYIDLTQLKAGDYTFANTSEKVGLEEIKGEKGSIEIYPNPARDEINIRFQEINSQSYDIRMVDSAGKEFYNHTHQMQPDQSELSLDVSRIKSDFVVVSINGMGKKIRLLK